MAIETLLKRVMAQNEIIIKQNEQILNLLCENKDGADADEIDPERIGKLGKEFLKKDN